jgi:dihydrofolate synthase / folylpolyglutamate synthase
MTLSYPKAIEHLYGLQRHGIKLGLENSRGLMAALGDPHQTFRSVHIAGTNGKGSTAAILASILSAAGYRTGLYTSPHLVDFTERMRVNGVPIAPERVVSLTEQTRAAAADIPVTFFEFTTAMAFLYFAESSVDFAVVEVGLGGRFDATNVLTPLVSVITRIDYDHQIYLGSSLEQIAREKAGIIKPGVPVVTSATSPDILRVIKTVSGKQGSPVYRVGAEVRVEGPSPQRFRYKGIRWDFSDLNCVLLGRHQLENACCALAALELVDAGQNRIGEASVRRGLSTVQWEGRLESMPRASSGAAVILDGAHNPGGARALRAYLDESVKPRKGRLILVIGILEDKDVGGILSELAPVADEVIVTRPRHERAATTESVKRHLENYPVRVTIRESVEEALRYAQSAAAAGDTICVTGSLFTIGEARSHITGSAQPSALRG